MKAAPSLGAVEAFLICGWSAFLSEIGEIFLFIFSFLFFDHLFLSHSPSFLTIYKAAQSEHFARARFCLSFPFSPLSLFLSFSSFSSSGGARRCRRRLFFLLSRRRLRPGRLTQPGPAAAAHMFGQTPKARLRGDQGVKDMVRRH